ncbi:MAG: LytTR family DNA-binding domain-containing protein, partial [Spirochaetota bacterium]
LRKQILGMLYLEHFALSGVFKHVNLGILNTLILQIAICLENIRLNENLSTATEVFKRVITRENPHKEIVENQHISIKEGSNHYILPYNKIVYIKAHNYFTIVHCTDKSYRSGKNLKEIEESLAKEKFFRIHKSFIVNLDYISHLQYFMSGNYVAYLKDEDETQVPVGKSYTPKIKKKLGIN